MKNEKPILCPFKILIDTAENHFFSFENNEVVGEPVGAVFGPPSVADSFTRSPPSAHACEFWFYRNAFSS